ncbi:MAG: hypothetical protein M1409_02860 [Actinobacteria bacterium]|nr:hypothetical protein [Actinomycetota bacterium]
MTDIDQIAEVYLEIKALGLDHAFDYKIPQEMTGKLNIGDAVSVPFKNRYETGYISRLKTKSGIPDENLKNIKRIISSIPIFNKQRLRLIHWMSFYYIQSVGKIIELFLPPGTKKNLNKLSNPEYFFKFDIFIYSSDKNLQQYIKEINIKKNYAKKKIFDFLIQNKYR